MVTRGEMTPGYQARMERTRWLREARFGMFIHWGVYAIPARGEWVRSAERMSIARYQQYVDEFDPVRYDPRAWARLAKQAGMQYAVMTAKHHDGFCLFDSALTEYKATNTPAKRDLIREYVDAFRAEGLRVGLYYSLPDWHHPDYPAYGDRQHPMRDNADYQHREHDFARYVDYLHGQVRELCTNYGTLDIMWFDFSYWQMTGEAWRASELVSMIHALQPRIVIDNRLGGDMHASDPVSYAGDFANPEQGIPREGLVNADGLPIPWEASVTLNNNWGYSASDHDYKSAAFIIRALVNAVSKGGNLIVNVGPNAYGEIPRPSQAILQEVGAWMARNGESIYGCGPAACPKPEWGRYTQCGHSLYAHVLEQVAGHINLQGLKNALEKARLLTDGSEVLLTDFWNAEVDSFDGPTDIFMNFAHPVQATFPLPDAIDTVVKLILR